MSVPKPVLPAFTHHDRRVTNRMDEEAKGVHRRLEGWARWARTTALCAYPSSTLLGVIIDHGIVGAAASHVPIAMPDSIAETDLAVRALPLLERAAVERYYLHWEPIEVSAKTLHMTVRDLQRLLNRARVRISTLLLICTRA